MKARNLLIVGLGIGYVLGARAGRERYEEIRDKAQELWHSPQVVRRREEAAAYARRQAPLIRDTLDNVVHAAPGVISDGANAIVDTATELVDSTASAAKTVATKTATTAKSAASAVATGAQGLAGKATAAAKSVTGSITGKITGKTATHD